MKIAYHLFGEEVKGDSSVGKYVERIRDTRTYGEVAGDVLRRWAFPLVPDLNEPGGTQYELRKGNVYVARDEVKLARYVYSLISLRLLLNMLGQQHWKVLCLSDLAQHSTHIPLFAYLRLEQIAQSAQTPALYLRISLTMSV
jgi:hypothetical protein